MEGKKMTLGHGPREKMREAGPEFLSDAELLALVLATGTRHLGVAQLAETVLDRYGGIRGLARRSCGEIRRVDGLGLAKATRVAAVFELGRRLAQRPLPVGTLIRSASDVAEHYAPHLRDRKQEVFMALLLDGRHRVIRSVRIAEGCLNAAIVHPREAFRPVVLEAAAAVIYVHNHPSGDPSPSDEDLALTQQLLEAGRLLAIDVVDHVIVGDTSHVSLAATGWTKVLPPYPG